MVSRLAVAALLVCLACIGAHAAETDQYLTWTVVLADSSGALNEYVNTEAQAFLDRINRRTRPIENRYELTRRFYLHLFTGLHRSRIRRFVNTSPLVDRYPPRYISFFQYQRMSIYRKPSFPFILPMARTVRVGDVYLGADKIGHFFGFGRRYLQRYVRYREQDGLDHEEAKREMVLWGLTLERYLVGGLVDGIISHADLEANYQGFRMAYDSAFGDHPYFTREDGQWVLEREFDLRDYFNPDFDESYNVSHFAGPRKRQAHQIIREEYCHLRDSDIVRRRFQRYAHHEPSFSKHVVQAFYAERGRHPQEEQSLDAICACVEGGAPDNAD